MFDFLLKPKKKVFPFIKPDVFTPVDAAISTSEAKRLYKTVMVAIGFLDRSEAADYAKWLGYAIKDREEDLKIAYSDAKAWGCDIAQEAKAALDAFKADKRDFLVDYMNKEIHGEHWRDLAHK